MNMTQDIVRIRLAVLMPRLKAWFKRQSTESLHRIEERIYVFIAPLALAYLAATVVGGLISNSLMSSIFASRARMNVRTEETTAVTLERPVMANTRDLQKIIKERNIFNSEGKFPEEKIGAQGVSTPPDVAT